MTVEIVTDPGQATGTACNAVVERGGRRLLLDWEGLQCHAIYERVTPPFLAHTADWTIEGITAADIGRVAVYHSHSTSRMWDLLAADRPLAEQIAPYGARPRSAAVIERWIAGFTPVEGV